MGKINLYFCLIIRGAVAMLSAIALFGCDGDGGSSGIDSALTNASQLVIESVQMGLPVNISEDDGAINGTVYPRNACEIFIALDSLNPTEQKTSM